MLPTYIIGKSCVSASRRVAIVASCFNKPLVDTLVEGAQDCWVRHGGQLDQLLVVRVPGAFELPICVKMLMEQKVVDGIVACGVLIRGATSHFDLIASQVTSSLGSLAVEASLPIGFGVITANSIAEAYERTGVKHANLGSEGMQAVIDLLSVKEQIMQLK